MKSFSTTRRRLLAALICIAASSAAHAQRIAGNPVDGYTAAGGDLGNDLYLPATSFSLAASYNITALSYFGWAFTSTPAPSSIDWYVFTNNGGQPGAILFSAMTQPYSLTTLFQNDLGYDINRYEVAVNGVVLDAGDYWVAFYNHDAERQPYTDNTPGSGWGYSFDDATWYPGPAYAFEVDGVESNATPEPASLVLVATGLFAVTMTRRRKRSA